GRSDQRLASRTPNLARAGLPMRAPRARAWRDRTRLTQLRTEEALRVKLIDRSKLADLMERERALFREQNPRSRELAEHAKRNLLYGVPMNWMIRWPGDHPVFVDR